MGSEGPALAGTLAGMRPRTLLHFLGLTGKSGVLRVDEVAVVLCRGRVIGGPEALDSVVAMLRTGQGSFRFEERVIVDDDPGVAVMDVLAQASEVLADWEDVGQVVPSSAVVVRLRESGGEARVSADAWVVGMAVAAGHETPSRLALELGWPMLRVGRAVKELVKAGLAEPTPPPRRRRPAPGQPARSTPALWPGQGEPEAWRTPWYDPGY